MRLYAPIEGLIPQQRATCYTQTFRNKKNQAYLRFKMGRQQLAWRW